MTNDKELGPYIKRVHLALENIRNKKLERLNLTGSQADIIFYLHKNSDLEITQREIEHYFKLSNPTVNGLLNRLEQKGFIKRVKSEKDARFRVIKLTDISKDFILEMHEKDMQNLDNFIFEGISESDQSIAFKVLKRVYENILEMDTK